MPALLYQGHGSFRLTSNNGRIIFVDPFIGGGYDKPADYILITHAHYDHSKIDLCIKNSGCKIITYKEALANGKYNRFDEGMIIIEAVEAGNKNHNSSECVGYVITIDQVKIYASGDTSMLESMNALASQNIDYALFCGDGLYNMDAGEAAECAKIVKAKNNILIHTVPDATRIFDLVKAKLWRAPNKLIIVPGEEINL